jgi:hypothetical protein
MAYRSTHCGVYSFYWAIRLRMVRGLFRCFTPSIRHGSLKNADVKLLPLSFTRYAVEPCRATMQVASARTHVCAEISAKGIVARNLVSSSTNVKRH